MKRAEIKMIEFSDGTKLPEVIWNKTTADLKFQIESFLNRMTLSKHEKQYLEWLNAALVNKNRNHQLENLL